MEHFGLELVPICHVGITGGHLTYYTDNKISLNYLKGSAEEGAGRRDTHPERERDLTFVVSIPK